MSEQEDSRKVHTYTRNDYLLKYMNTPCPLCGARFSFVPKGMLLECGCGESAMPVCPVCGKELYDDEDTHKEHWCPICGKSMTYEDTKW